MGEVTGAAADTAIGVNHRTWRSPAPAKPVRNWPGSTMSTLLPREAEFLRQRFACPFEGEFAGRTGAEVREG
jgi:hypothetical protein